MFTINDNDTIAAISTGMTDSGIGIVRMSGDDAVNIISKIFRPASEKDLRTVSSHTVHYGNLMDGDVLVDEALVLIMRAPKTYTRQDVVEIDCHGGTFVTRKVLELVLKNGARPAEPGEFTKRAFLNGRIDLAQAEAVIDIINSENDMALKSAAGQLKGSVSRKISDMRARLIEQIAYIEAALDDPEHIDMTDYGKTLLPVVNGLGDEVKKLISTADDGRIIKEGIKTVILGKPNAGKSSLLNALLGQERAIVTDIAGTTRDLLEERLKLGDVTLNIVDTAGIRRTDEPVEKIGVEKARESAQEADLIIYVADSSKLPDEDDLEIIKMIRGKQVIILLNKQDLDDRPDENAFSDILESVLSDAEAGVDLLSGIEEFGHGEEKYNDSAGDYVGNDVGNAAGNIVRKNVGRVIKIDDCSEKLSDPDTQFSKIRIIRTSMTEGTGLDELTDTIRDMFYKGDIDFNDQIYITSARQKAALLEAESSLSAAVSSIEDDMPEDFFTIDLMAAYTALGSVIGEAVEDDLADEIFSKFCMGK